MVILLFGPPGCGKGTQAGFITRLLGVPTISTGDMFRSECAAGTPLGKQASQIMAQGGLVGDHIVNQMVANRLAKPDCQNGFLLDGYPRSLAQGQYLDPLLRELGRPSPAVLYLNVPSSVLVARITARRQCPSCSRIYNLLHQPPQREGLCDLDGAPLTRRADDTEEVVLARLKAYESSTGPLLEYYEGPNLRRLDGNRSVEEVHRDIEGVLEATLVQSGARK